MMKSPGLRKRVISTTAILSLIIFAFSCVSFFINYRVINNRIKENIEESSREYIFENIDIAREQINNLLSFLNTGGYVDFACNNWNIKDSVAADKLQNELIKSLDRVIATSDIIKSVVVIGENDNQRNITWSSGNKKDMSGIFDLRAEDILKTIPSQLFKDWGETTVIDKNELRKLIDTNRKKQPISNAKINALYKFADLLDGELAWSTVTRSTVISIIINKDYYLKHLEADSSITKLLLCNGSGTTITGNIVNPTVDEIKKIKETGKKYTIENYKTNDMQKYDLYILTNSDGDSAGVCLLILILGVVFLLISVIFIRMSSKFVVHPIYHLKEAISSINVTRPEKKQAGLIKISIRGRIFLVMFLSIFIPSMIFSISLYGILYNDVQDRNKTTTNLEKNMAVQTLNTSVNDCTQNITNSMESILVSVTKDEKQEIRLEISDILKYYSSSIKYLKYLTLTNAEGDILYQSKYFNEYAKNQQFIKQITQKFEDYKSEYALFSFTNDSYGDNGIVLVETVKGNSVSSGRLLLFFDSTVLNSFKRVGRNIEYIITDENKQILFDSGYILGNAIDNRSELLVSLRDDTTTNISGIQYQVSTIQIGRKGDWKVYIFKRLDDIQQFIRYFSMLFIYSLAGATLVILILSFIFSLNITKNFNRLKKSMQNSSDNLLYESIDYENNDEIGDLINSYSNMIKRIEILNKENVEQKVREHSLDTLRAQAELQSLQNQINPHFLFNSLSIISGEATKIKNKKIITMITAIAKILRYGLHNAVEVKIQDEVENVQEYIKIQKMRYDDKFDALWEVDNSLLECNILKLIIEPLVENAFNHGIYECIEGGIVRVSIQKIDENIEIVVSDNGIGMSSEILAELREHISADSYQSRPFIKGNGTGLRNVYQRIRKYYNYEADMKIESLRMKGTTVTISIPYKMTLPLRGLK